MRWLFKQESPFFLALPALVWQFLFLCIPLVLVLYTSFHSVAPDAPWYVWTLDHYVSLATIAHVLILVRSFVLASLTTVTCLILGYPVAYYLALHVRRWRTVLLFLLTLPFWTNFLTQAYAWFFILGKRGLISSVLQFLSLTSEPVSFLYTHFAVLCVMIYCYLPFMILPLYSVLQKLDRRLLEASRDLGATRWQTFTHVTLPLSRIGIRTGCLLVFIPAFGEFVIPMIMGGSRYMYVGSAIVHYVLASKSEHVGAAFTCLSAAVLLSIMVLGMWYIRVVRSSMRK